METNPLHTVPQVRISPPWTRHEAGLHRLSAQVHDWTTPVVFNGDSRARALRAPKPDPWAMGLLW